LGSYLLGTTSLKKLPKDYFFPSKEKKKKKLNQTSNLEPLG
jgi:hypothetical protein